MKTLMNKTILAILAATSLSALGQSTGWLQTGAGPYNYTKSLSVNKCHFVEDNHARSQIQ